MHLYISPLKCMFKTGCFVFVFYCSQMFEFLVKGYEIKKKEKELNQFLGAQQKVIVNYDINGLKFEF